MTDRRTRSSPRTRRIAPPSRTVGGPRLAGPAPGRTHPAGIARRTIGCVILGVIGVLCMIIAIVGPPRKSDAQTAPPTPTATPTATPTPVATVPVTTIAPVITTAPGATTTPVATTSPVTTAPATPTGWTLLAGGDSLLTRNVGDDDPFAAIDPPLAIADLAIVNVETAITTRGRAAVKQYTFRSPPAFASRLAAAGVDVGSLANNHSLDFGYDALADTVSALQQAGVTPIGAGANLSAALAPAERTFGTTRVAIIGASQIIPNGAWPATPTKPGIASAGKHRLDEHSEQLLTAVRAARQSHDLVIVFMHWGIEGAPCPSRPQLELSELLHDAGARIVIGAHPHVLQPVVRTPDGGITAYSLGNFIWDPRSGASADTGVLQIDLTGSNVETVRFHPHRLDQGWAAATRSARDGERIKARVTKSCAGLPVSSVPIDSSLDP